MTTTSTKLIRHGQKDKLMLEEHGRYGVTDGQKWKKSQQKDDRNDRRTDERKSRVGKNKQNSKPWVERTGGRQTDERTDGQRQTLVMLEMREGRVENHTPESLFGT